MSSGAGPPACAGWIGLAERVRYREELGFVFVDDGERVVKFDAVLLGRMTGVSAAASPELASLASRYPSIFVVYDSPHEAHASVSDRSL